MAPVVVEPELKSDTGITGNGFIFPNTDLYFILLLAELSLFFPHIYSA